MPRMSPPFAKFDLLVAMVVVHDVAGGEHVGVGEIDIACRRQL